jgi:hypothetical protein
VAEITPEPSGRFVTSSKIYRLVGMVLLTIMLFNGALLYWGIRQPPSVASLADYTTLPAYQAIVSKYPTDHITVTHVKGIFGKDNPDARQLAAFMLKTFGQVMVVSLPAEQSSIVVAGESLPFDRNTLATLLWANGETQFTIYDGLDVNAIVEDTLSAAVK